MKKTTIYLDDDDYERLEQMKKALGLPSATAAIRIAIRAFQSTKK